FLVFPALASPRLFSLSLLDALPILYFPVLRHFREAVPFPLAPGVCACGTRHSFYSVHIRNFRFNTPYYIQKVISLRSQSPPGRPDRKSTRLNSSHVSISYAVFCLKK